MTPVQSGETYVRKVLDGKIPACKWVRLACQRHVEDKKRTDWPYKFDSKKALRAIKFIENFHHVKGRWAARKEAFILQPWQYFMVMSIFGWVRKDTGTRRFRRAMLLVPRKNGKSPLAAAIGLYMLADDAEHGAEVFSGATSEDQAWEVFRPARLMAEKEPDFLEHYGVEVMKSNLHIPRNGSRFEPVIGKPGDGASPSCAIVDEYHEHQTDVLLDTMETGMVGREQPLSLIITTAGDNLGGPCHSLQLELQKILEGTIENDTFWGVIYTIDLSEKVGDETIPGDDWADESALVKANPNYGISVDPVLLKQAQQEAIQQSRKQGIFQTKHLNVWVGARQAFFNIKAWQACRKVSMADCKGSPLFAAVDLASTKDIAALALLFRLDEKKFAAFGKYYIPEARIQEIANSHYAGWQRDGFLVATPGNMIDYRQIKQDILDINAEWGIRKIGFDPAYAQHLAQMLDEEMGQGICEMIKPTVVAFSEPMKVLDALILEGAISHDHNPAMAWMMSNVVAKMDQKDGVYPNKEKPESKIDGPVALIMAMNQALSAGEPDTIEYTGLHSIG
jgi:phage terminase large subunit-like protein